jgi:antitoxin ParD1/3/4
MRHEDFQIGVVFWCGGRRWRCTDIGTRVITAIRLDRVDVESTAPEQRRTLGHAEAEAEGWFNGPPYAVNEVMFDEYDIEDCSLEAVADGADTSLCTPDSEAADDTWDSPEDKAERMAQARVLRDQARAGGLRFDAYLPPRLADWLLGHIERGTFRDPSEAVFVMLGEQEELEPHADLRRELLKRRIQAAIDDPRPPIPAEEVFERFRKKLAEPLAEPAIWRKEP